MTKSTLSPRQTACLEWVAAGKTSWEIACILCITERTVNFHLQQVYQRLGVHTRAAAVASAIRQGLVNEIGLPDELSAASFTNEEPPDGRFIYPNASRGPLVAKVAAHSALTVEPTGAPQLD